MPVTRLRAALPLLATLATGCRVEHQTIGDVVLDGEGLPDCGASYVPADTCSALKPWTSSVPDGYADDASSIKPVKWVGTEVQPAFCSDDAAEAEAWVLEQHPDEDGGSHLANTSDARWTDILRYDADGAYLERHRIMRCDFMAGQASTPPTVDSVAEFARYAGTPDPALDFFPVAREMSRWRETPLGIQVILSYGESHTEAWHLRACSVRCGDCEDDYGSVRAVTGILEVQDWVYDETSQVVSFELTDLGEADCQIPQ